MNLRRRRFNNKGLQMVEIILIISVALLILGGIGWYVSKKVLKFNTTQQQTNEAVNKVDEEAKKLKGN